MLLLWLLLLLLLLLLFASVVDVCWRPDGYCCLETTNSRCCSNSNSNSKSSSNSNSSGNSNSESSSNSNSNSKMLCASVFSLLLLLFLFLSLFLSLCLDLSLFLFLFLLLLQASLPKTLGACFWDVGPNSCAVSNVDDLVYFLYLVVFYLLQQLRFHCDLFPTFTSGQSNPSDLVLVRFVCVFVVELLKHSNLWPAAQVTAASSLFCLNAW